MPRGIGARLENTIWPRLCGIDRVANCVMFSWCYFTRFPYRLRYANDCYYDVYPAEKKNLTVSATADFYYVGKRRRRGVLSLSFAIVSS